MELQGGATDPPENLGVRLQKGRAATEDQVKLLVADKQSASPSPKGPFETLGI